MTAHQVESDTVPVRLLIAPMSNARRLTSEQVPGAMAAVADACVGEHDVRAFCRRPPPAAASDPIPRRILDARWTEVSPSPVGGVPGQLLRFEITANAFCHQMVRSLVAFLVDAGRRRRTAADLMERLGTGSRLGLPAPAPAGGLCLESVEYPAGLLQWDLGP